MAKIVHNACFGGFGLSETAIQRYAELAGLKLYPEEDNPWEKIYWTIPQEERVKRPRDWAEASPEERDAYDKCYTNNAIHPRNFTRTDPILVQVVEELGPRANGPHANLQIAEVPSGSRYRIDEYDGSESVETPESYEWEIAP